MNEYAVLNLLSLIGSALGVLALVWESYGVRGLKFGRGLLLFFIFIAIFFVGIFVSPLVLESGT